MNGQRSLPLWRQLQATIDVLEQVAAGRSANEALAGVGGELRPGVQALAFHVWRHYGRASAIGSVLAKKAPRPWIQAALHCGLALLDESSSPGYDSFTLVDQMVEAVKRRRKDSHQAPFVNGCLRRYLRERQAIDITLEHDLSSTWNFPLWWIKRVQKDHPQQWESILRASNAPGPMTLRANRRHASNSEYVAALRGAGIAARAQGANAVVLEKPTNVQKLPGFAAGEVSVQDAGAQLAAEMILAGFEHSPQTHILDACAAPGGKTGHLLELSDASVLAVELDSIRARRIKENLERLRLTAEVRCASVSDTDAWWDGHPFDLILLDAPCTASGIVRRHPDVRWLRRESDISALAQTQADMLQKVWGLLRPGGRLLYCTCSIFAAEGVDQQRAFLRNNKDASLLPSPGHLLPTYAAESTGVDQNALTDHDGFFYALFEKTPA